MNARTWLETLVGFDTTSRNSNLALIETVRDWLRGQGVEAWLAHNPERTKANLFATLPAQDGNQQGGIVLRVTPTWCRWMARTGARIRSS